jgi:WD40 repeat protein
VSSVKWLGLTNVVSAGDDKTVKLWDITAKASVQTFTGHQDYARTLSVVPGTNLILSGSLDGTAKLWDPRVSTGAVSTFEHGQGSQGIVYSVLPLKGGTMLLTSGGSGIKVWDMSASTTHPVKEMWNHQKEVTALCGNDEGSRVLAGGLDGHIKIYDVSTWKVVHGVKYPAAILTVSLSVCTFRSHQLTVAPRKTSCSGDVFVTAFLAVPFNGESDGSAFHDTIQTSAYPSLQRLSVSPFGSRYCSSTLDII